MMRSNPQNATQTQARFKPQRRLRVLLAVVTLLIAAVVMVVLLLFPSGIVHADVIGHNSKVGHKVQQSQLLEYCPSRMELADSGAYGDAQFQASEGNIASSAMYASFGSVYQAQVQSLADGVSSSADLKVLEDSGSYEGTSVKTLSDDARNGSSLLVSKLLDSEEGTGASASVASWATTGDLKGLSAASCVAPSLKQSFLLPATGSGTTLQLVVANPSDKAVSVRIQVQGTQSGDPVALSTGNTLNVSAHDEAMIDLSAGAPGQNGLFAQVASQETPVAAVVRSVMISGLSPKGSDFALPLPQPRKSQMLAGVLEGDDVNMAMYAEHATQAEVSWLSDGGETPAKVVQLQSGKVNVAALGVAPKQAKGLVVHSGKPVWVQAQARGSGSGGHSDFAFIPAGVGAGQSALAIPGNVTGTLTFVNGSDTASTGKVYGYDASGKPAGSRDVNVGAHKAASVQAHDIGGSAVLFRLVSDKTMVWGARLGQKDMSDAKLAAVAYIASNALEPTNAEIFSERSALAVR